MPGLLPENSSLGQVTSQLFPALTGPQSVSHVDDFVAQQQQLAQAFMVAKAAEAYYQTQMNLQAQQHGQGHHHVVTHASPGQYSNSSPTTPSTSRTGQTPISVPIPVIHQPIPFGQEPSSLAGSSQPASSYLPHHAAPAGNLLPQYTLPGHVSPATSGQSQVVNVVPTQPMTVTAPMPPTYTPLPATTRINFNMIC